MNMRNKPSYDIIFSTTSWIIVFALIYGVVVLWVAPPTGGGPIGQWLGVVGAQIFYSVIYGTEALVLGYAKLFKKKNLRKIALLAIYFTALFTGILTWILAGFGWKLADNALLAVLSFGCFLYWKFKTEYIDPAAIFRDTKHLRS